MNEAHPIFQERAVLTVQEFKGRVQITNSENYKNLFEFQLQTFLVVKKKVLCI